MALDRGQRLANVMDTVFDLDSREAAAVAGVSPGAYRRRLSRACAPGRVRGSVLRSREPRGGRTPPPAAGGGATADGRHAIVHG